MKAADRRSVAAGRLRLTALGLGGAALAGMYAPVAAQEAADTLATAWDAGLRYIDTAPHYGYTLGEHRAGAFLRERPRDEFVIGTKVGRLMRPDAAVVAGMRSAAQVRQNVGWFEQPVPDGLWTALRERGLVDAAAPSPSGRSAAP